MKTVKKIFWCGNGPAKKISNVDGIELVPNLSSTNIIYLPQLNKRSIHSKLRLKTKHPKIH